MSDTSLLAITQSIPLAAPLEDLGFSEHCSLNISLSSSHRSTEPMEPTGYQHSPNAIVPPPGMDMDLANLPTLRTQLSGSLYSPDAIGTSYQNDTMPWPDDSAETSMAMQSQINHFRDEDKPIMNNKEPSRLSQDGSTCLKPTTCQPVLDQDVPMSSLPHAFDISFKLAHMEDTILRTDPSNIPTDPSDIDAHRDAIPEKERDFSMITAPNSCDISSDPCLFTPMRVTTLENDRSTINPRGTLTSMKAATSEESSSAMSDVFGVLL